MRRYASVISRMLLLVLTAMVLLLWVRSYRWSDLVTLVLGNGALDLNVFKGQATVTVVTHAYGRFGLRVRPYRSDADLFTHMKSLSLPNATMHEWMGIRYAHADEIGPEPGYTEFSMVRFPVALAFIALAAYPAIYLVRRRLQQRQKGRRQDAGGEAEHRA